MTFSKRKMRKPGGRGVGTAFAVSLAALMSNAQAHQPVTQPSVQVLRPSEVGRGHAADTWYDESQVPGTGHGHVRQRMPYGQGYRYGHVVNGPQGDIIIWSPNTTEGYGSSARARFGPKHRTRSNPQLPTGPRLEYKRDYGKPPGD